MNEPLAHSARPKQGIGPQTYREHVLNVVDGSQKRVDAMLRHYSPAKGWPENSRLKGTVTTASMFHDLGKLDPGFQKTLKENRTSEEHIRHEDAGSAWLIAQGKLESAALISAHHQGLVCYRIETDDASGNFRPSRTLSSENFRIDDAKTRQATDHRLQEYLEHHNRLFPDAGSSLASADSNLHGLTRRLLLSCLVDADHFDTALHYQNEREVEAPAGRWDERLVALKAYVKELAKSVPTAPAKAEQKRQAIRDELFNLCCDADREPRLRSCDAVVGSGKTTALMAHLLQVAIARQLRHIIIVLPYTNIISQSVEVYRKALCLEGENPEEVVAEHHHQVEFKEADIRHLTTTWQAPIIVTTAVQFFETLAANNPSRLRKLHELPGSAVFLDEAHAALPAKLWPVCWNWLLQWTRRWNGHLVLASGSLPEFWKMPEFRCLCEGRRTGESPVGKEPNILSLAPSLKKTAEEAEHLRVKFRTEPTPLSVDELTERITTAKGPRIVVVNTVQSAACLAAHLRNVTQKRILHLSTALTPAHRTIIVLRVKNLLKFQNDWILVATSLVEAGMDFSFHCGFRQRASAASLIQLGGRVNRAANLGDESYVLDFTFADTRNFPDNPSLKPSQEALVSLFANNDFSPNKPSDLSAICLAALKAEFRAGTQDAAANLIQTENDADYPEVAKQCRVIQSDTRTIIVDPQIAHRLKNHKPVTRLEIGRNSVQMYHSKIDRLGIPLLRPDLDIYQLPKSWAYDPDFLGYMAEPLRFVQSEIPDGYYV